MGNQNDIKKKQKKNYVEFKSCKNNWTKAELISLDRLNKATLKLSSGELIHRTTRTGFRWGVTKKIRKRGAFSWLKRSGSQEL